MITPSILDQCAATTSRGFPIPEDGSCSCIIGGVWHTFVGVEYRRVRAMLPSSPTNWSVLDQFHRMNAVEQKIGNFVHVRLP